LLAMQEFGMTVFESSEYASHNRTDHQYVYDLYRSYLMRDPDPQGWAFWEGQVASWGREQLRHAFDESDEFHNIVATLTASGQPPYFDAQVGRDVYILATSSGRRTELRQVGTTSTYEAGDSSYLQLTAGSSLLLRTTDGTRMSYGQFANGWQATGVEDRNG